MKSERKLKVEDLETEAEDRESELFIADLGQVRGGQSIPFGCGPADGPCEGSHPLPGQTGLLEDLLKYIPEDFLKYVPGGVGQSDDHVTTLAAFGEE